MKKLTVSLFSVMVFFFSMIGTGNAVLFTDTQSLNRTLVGSGTTEWTHATPSDLSVPPDSVNYATLELFASGINSLNDYVSVEGVLQGVLDNAGWVWSWQTWSFNYEGTTYDIAEVFASWTPGDILNVSLTYTEPSEWSWSQWSWVPGSFCLNTSVLSIDYDNGSAPVPEPATLLLLGSGLLGLAGFRRKIK